MTEKQFEVVGKMVLSLMVFGLAALCLRLTNGETGIGWGILGLVVIWG